MRVIMLFCWRRVEVKHVVGVIGVIGEDEVIGVIVEFILSQLIKLDFKVS